MTHDEMDALTADTGNKSEKIRRLFAAGVTTADIGRYLDIRYQHVYNVLLRTGAIAKKTPNAADGAFAVSSFVLTLGRDGQVQLPSDILQAQGLSVGDKLVCRTGPDGLTIMSRARAIEYLRELARARMPAEADLFEALLGGKPSSEADQSP